jgi:hypothetical protein
LCYAVLLLGFASQVAQAAIDMDATCITHTPKCYLYAVDYPNNIPTENYQTVGKKRWPDLGATVTFTAHFINKGNVTCPAGWQYEWFINGVAIGAGAFDTTIAAGAEGTPSINWAWNINGSDSDQAVKRSSW